MRASKAPLASLVPYFPQKLKPPIAMVLFVRSIGGYCIDAHLRQPALRAGSMAPVWRPLLYIWGIILDLGGWYVVFKLRVVRSAAASSCLLFAFFKLSSSVSQILMRHKPLSCFEVMGPGHFLFPVFSIQVFSSSVCLFTCLCQC